ncbi:MAG: hypothetical protein WA030_01665 [Candidatus Microsaccharimonas sp.]
MKFKTHRIQHPKRLALIILGLLVLATGTFYGIQSYMAWNRLQTFTTDSSASLKKNIETTLASAPVSGTQTDQLQKILDDFKKKYPNQTCDVSFLYSWQAIIPALSDIKKGCVEKMNHVSEVSKAITALIEFNTFEAKVNALLTAGLESTAAIDDPTATKLAWQTFHNDYATLINNAPTNTSSPVADKISASDTAISNALDDLVKANTTEDKAAFDAAITKINTAYDGLKGIKTVALTTQTSLVETLIKAYEAL